MMQMLNNILKHFLCISLGLSSFICLASDMNADERTFIEFIKQQLSVQVSVQRIPAEQVHTIVSRNLDLRMEKLLTKVDGINLHTRSVDSTVTPIQLALLELIYPDEATAVQALRQLGKKRYFQHSKILIPFSIVQIGHRLLIVFTENAGNSSAIAVIEKFPTEGLYPRETLLKIQQNR
jgi:hypothetical protein